MDKLLFGLFSAALALGSIQGVQAQVNAADSVMSHAGGHRLRLRARIRGRR